MAPSARMQRTTGEIVNLMSVDGSRFEYDLPFVHMIWSSFLQLGIAVYMLYRLLGVAAFVGLGFMLLLVVPINSISIYLVEKFQFKQMAEKDLRIKLISEILNGIKV